MNAIAVIRSCLRGASLVLTLSMLPVPRGAAAQEIIRTVYPGSISSDDRFGSSVALSGDFSDGTYEILVGAPGCDWHFWDFGCLYVVTRDIASDSWKITAMGGILDGPEKDSLGVGGPFHTGAYMRSVGYANSDRALDTFVLADDGSTARVHVSDVTHGVYSCDGCPYMQLGLTATGLGMDGVAELGDLDGNGAGEYATRDVDSIRVYFHEPTSSEHPVVSRVTGWSVPPEIGPGSVSATGDLDGDGIFDLVLSGPGRLAVVFMDVTGHPRHVVVRDGLSGGLPLDLSTEPGFGRVMAPAGDVDGDGTGDLWIGLPDVRQERGAIALLMLAPDGSVRNWVRYDGEDIERGLNPGDRFGHAISSLRDLYGRGSADLVVGSPGADVDGTDTGAIHVLSVSPEGRIHERVRIDNRFAPMSDVLVRVSAIESIPDFDGDGIDDYLAASDDAKWDRHDWYWSGELAIHLARADGTIRERIPLRFNFPGYREEIDRHVYLGGILPDLDGDGRREFWVTARHSRIKGPFLTGILYLDSTAAVRRQKVITLNGNSAWVPELVGDESGDGIPDMIVSDVRYNNVWLVKNDVSTSDDSLQVQPLYTGRKVFMWSRTVVPGDLDRDGHDDAVNIRFNRGSVLRLIHGRGWDDPSAVRPLREVPVGVPAELPVDDIRDAFTLGTVRDLDGDGLRELLIDVWHLDQTRAAYIYFLNPDGTGRRAIRIWDRGDNPVTGGGEATSAWDAGDMNGDGIPEIAVRVKGAIVTISIADLLPDDW